MKFANRVALVVLLLASLVALAGFAPGKTSSPQDDAQCVRDCAAKNERYRYYVEQLRRGSCQACAHCAAAALYQCVLDNCKLTEEKRKEYSDKRDEELRAAKELGTECRVN